MLEAYDALFAPERPPRRPIRSACPAARYEWGKHAALAPQTWSLSYSSTAAGGSPVYMLPVRSKLSLTLGIERDWSALLRQRRLLTVAIQIAATIAIRQKK